MNIVHILSAHKPVRFLRASSYIHRLPLRWFGKKKVYRPNFEKLREKEEERRLSSDKKLSEYDPQRELRFDENGELSLINNYSQAVQQCRKASAMIAPILGISSYFFYKNVSFMIANGITFFPMLKATALFSIGMWYPILLLHNVKLAKGYLVYQIKLKENGKEIVLHTLDSKQHVVNVKDITLTDPKVIKNTLYSSEEYFLLCGFYVFERYFYINGIKKEQETIDLLQSVMHNVPIKVPESSSETISDEVVQDQQSESKSE